MTRRYYVPDLPPKGGVVELPSGEAQHALRVMRVEVGDEVVLFDGRGHETTAQIDSFTRSDCLCRAQPPHDIDRELSRNIHLAIAFPKPDRAREMIERLTEVGVSKVTPLIAERTQRPPSDSLISKLNRAVVEACKQCERNYLLELGPITPSLEFFAGDHQGRRLVAHPGADKPAIEAISGGTDIVVAIGPEGGFTDNEIQAAEDSGFERIGLGSRIYRVETAATVIASALSLGEAG